MPLPPIPSRPVYGTLQPRPGGPHIFIADAAGMGAIADMAARCPPSFFANATLILIAMPEQPVGETGRHLFRQQMLVEYPAAEAASLHLAQLLSTARMGVQLYAAGSEGLIGQAVRAGVTAGLERASIVTEHRGSTARRVQCVHCKNIMDGVTTQPVPCTQCGLHLFVRDHYSHRIAAFQGVCIDAEQPGSAPAPEAAFP